MSLCVLLLMFSIRNLFTWAQLFQEDSAKCSGLFVLGSEVMLLLPIGFHKYLSCPDPKSLLWPFSPTMTAV
jgi:hypothetical protein